MNVKCVVTVQDSNVQIYSIVPEHQGLISTCYLKDVENTVKFNLNLIIEEIDMEHKTTDMLDGGHINCPYVAYNAHA